MAQLVKNLPAMQGTPVRSLGWEDTLEKGKATHSSILACIVHGVAKSWMRLSNFYFYCKLLFYLNSQIDVLIYLTGSLVGKLQ